MTYTGTVLGILCSLRLRLNSFKLLFIHNELNTNIIKSLHRRMDKLRTTLYWTISNKHNKNPKTST